MSLKYWELVDWVTSAHCWWLNPNQLTVISFFFFSFFREELISSSHKIWLYVKKIYIYIKSLQKYLTSAFFYPLLLLLWDHCPFFWDFFFFFDRTHYPIIELPHSSLINCLLFSRSTSKVLHNFTPVLHIFRLFKLKK